MDPKIFNCPCGSACKNNRSNILSHKKTEKHKIYIESNPEISGYDINFIESKEKIMHQIYKEIFLIKCICGTSMLEINFVKHLKSLKHSDNMCCKKYGMKNKHGFFNTRNPDLVLTPSNRDEP